MSARTLFTASAAFEAARHVDDLPEGHRARRVHGHSFLAGVRCALPEGWARFPGGEVARLAEALAATAGRLDYRLLNETVGQPTDENLARWLRAQLDLPGLAQVSLRSSAHAGVDLDAAGRAHVWRRYAFQSAHRLPNVRPGHKCGRLHGHGFEAIVHARVDGATGAPDADALDARWAPLHAELDHACLNDLPGLENPTSEMLSSWLWRRLAAVLPTLSWVTVYETATSGALYDGAHYRIWKEFRLDSALRLARAPQGARERRIHGHTYVLRLHLAAPLDAVQGWTVDFGDVKELFAPVYAELDHQPLHEIADLADCDTASLARWILARARARLPAVDRVDLYETAGCGAIVTAGDDGPALPV